MTESQESSNTQKTVVKYYVDESGDGVLFDKHGNSLLEKPDRPKCFILGLVQLEVSKSLNKKLRELREFLLGDPYYAGIPSLSPEQKKTALYFHARDDIPEVRERVFRILSETDFKLFAVVRRMDGVLQEVQNSMKQSSTYRYNPNDLYDHTVRRLFKDRLHKKDEYKIYFARRGKKDRTRALRTQLEIAKENFRKQWGIESQSSITVIPVYSWQSAGLQVVDYMLWALQRLYSRGEDRYWNYISDKMSLIIDVDDKRKNAYGVYYSKTKPLIRAALFSDGIG
ncbi:MAG: DUF3800 domain-containing protein [Planctomycetota bacterium]|nr:MAG: DUF3800 domain-containing protein [Planctomycetota bacterium]